MKTHRIARVNEVIREVAAETILFELRDPRVKNITVTRVETAADLQSAKIYVSVMGSEKEQLRAVGGLNNAAGFIQSRLAKRLTTRFLPVLAFHIDEGIKKSLEVARILQAERDLANGTLDDAEGLEVDLEENQELETADTTEGDVAAASGDGALAAIDPEGDEVLDETPPNRSEKSNSSPSDGEPGRSGSSSTPEIPPR